MIKNCFSNLIRLLVLRLLIKFKVFTVFVFITNLNIKNSIFLRKVVSCVYTLFTEILIATVLYFFSKKLLKTKNKIYLTINNFTFELCVVLFLN